MVLKDKYEGCRQEIAEELKKGKVVRCYLWEFKDSTMRWPHIGWVVDYLPFPYHKYQAIIDIDTKVISSFEMADPLIEEERPVLTR